MKQKTSTPTTPSERLPASGRPWGVALLVWAAVTCTSAIVLLAELQFAGPGHFSTPKGSSELRDFVRAAFFYPGLVLPALIIVRPRWSAAVCALLLVAFLGLLFVRSFQASTLILVPAFLGGQVLPAVLIAIATLLAYRRGDWRALRSSRSAA